MNDRQRVIIMVPNALTALRVISIGPIIYCIMHAIWPVSLVLFIGAALTDYFDGFIARRYEVVSYSGALFDIIADKCLILGTTSALLITAEYIPCKWILYCILLRELGLILATGILHNFLHTFKVHVQWVGKCAMMLQFLVIVLILGSFSGYQFNSTLFMFSTLSVSCIVFSLLSYAWQIYSYLMI